MPDTFRLLNDSFQDQPPMAEGEGFYDFNALSRIATAQPNMLDSDEKRLRKPETPPPVPADMPAHSAAEYPSAQASEAQSRPVSPAFATQKGAEPPQSSQSSTMQQMRAGLRRAESSDGLSSLSQGIASRGEPREKPIAGPDVELSSQRNGEETLFQSNVNATTWRNLPLSEFMMRLRSTAPVKVAVQRRLHGIFRK